MEGGLSEEEIRELTSTSTSTEGLDSMDMMAVYVLSTMKAKTRKHNQQDDISNGRNDVVSRPTEAPASQSTSDSKRNARAPKPRRAVLPKLPPVDSSLLNIMGSKQSAPFEKPLTNTDLSESHSRFLIAKEHYEGYVRTLLRPDELNKVETVGVRVTLYGPCGKAYEVTLKHWSKKSFLLNSPGWKSFLGDYEGLTADEHYVGVWMFRHVDNDRLSCIMRLTN